MLILTSADMKSRVLTARRLGSVSSGVVMAENVNLHGDVSVDTGVALDANSWGGCQSLGSLQASRPGLSELGGKEHTSVLADSDIGLAHLRHCQSRS